MRAVFLSLLLANLAAGIWLLLGEPLEMTREPGRLALQVDADRFRLLSGAQLEEMRTQASTAPAAGPTADPAEMPSLSCVEIGNFTSEAGARKMRARLTALGLGERLTSSTTEHATRFVVHGVDARTEARIDEILQDFTRQELTHCLESAAR